MKISFTDKMAISTYRTGQAAKILGTSSHILRRLCETGSISAELGAGGQWQIPVDEVDRLKKEGIPPIPQLTLERPGASSIIVKADGGGRSREHARSQAVSDERDKADVAEIQLRRRRIELEHQELEDRFRERQRKEAEERQVEQRRRWEHQWHEYVRSSLPNDLAPSRKVSILSEAEPLIRASSPKFVKQEVDDLIETGLADYRREKKAAKSAVEHDQQYKRTLARLDVDLIFLPASLKKEAVHAIRLALTALPVGCGPQTLDKTKDGIVEQFKNRARKEEDERHDKALEAFQRNTDRNRAVQDAINHALAYLSDEYGPESFYKGLWMRGKLEPRLAKRFERGQFRAASDAYGYVEDLVDQWIDEEEN